MFKNIIKKERLKKELSQRELGDILGVTQQAVGRWEKGLAKPDTSTLEKISSFFNVSVDYLLGKESMLGQDQINIGVLKLAKEGYLDKIADLTEEQRNKVYEYIDFLIMKNNN